MVFIAEDVRTLGVDKALNHHQLSCLMPISISITMFTVIKLVFGIAAIQCCLPTVAGASSKTEKVDELAVKGLANLAAYKARYPSQSKCTIASAVKRKEW